MIYLYLSLWLSCGALASLVIWKTIISKQNAIMLDDLVALISAFIIGPTALILSILFWLLLKGGDITVWKRKPKQTVEQFLNKSINAEEKHSATIIRK